MTTTTISQALKQRLADAEMNERHLTNAETKYWCDQYKQIAIAALSQVEGEPVQKYSDEAIKLAQELRDICGDRQSSAPEASERELFERWVNAGNLDKHSLVTAAWSAWQAARQAKHVPEWLPIEAAPKTGRTILLGYFNSLGNWRTMRGQYFTQERIEEEWEDPDCCEEGWYETSVEADDVPNCWRTNPTHWMPLPAAPSVQSNDSARKD